jgi:hypothetical protein
MRDQNRPGALKHFCFFPIHRSCHSLQLFADRAQDLPCKVPSRLGSCGPLELKGLGEIPNR